MRKKQYYIPGVDNFSQLVETPASKEKTDTHRYIVNTAISVVAAVASVVAAVISVVAFLGD